MPERLECEVLQKARYINALTFTFYLPFSTEVCHVQRHPHKWRSVLQDQFNLNDI